MLLILHKPIHWQCLVTVQIPLAAISKVSQEATVCASRHASEQGNTVQTVNAVALVYDRDFEYKQVSCGNETCKISGYNGATPPPKKK